MDETYNYMYFSIYNRLIENMVDSLRLLYAYYCTLICSHFALFLPAD